MLQQDKFSFLYIFSYEKDKLNKSDIFVEYYRKIYM